MSISWGCCELRTVASMKSAAIGIGITGNTLKADPSLSLWSFCTGKKFMKVSNLLESPLTR